MGDKLTFVRCKVQVMVVTHDAIKCKVRINRNTNIWAESWIPRSNLRYNDDKRMDEFKEQFEAGTRFINAFIDVAEWWIAKQTGWKIDEPTA